MFTENQKLLRSLICGTNKHNKIALEIPKVCCDQFLQKVMRGESIHYLRTFNRNGSGQKRAPYRSVINME